MAIAMPSAARRSPRGSRACARWALAPLSWLIAACAAAPSGRSGTLLAVGGGLDNDASAVYQRLLAPLAGNVRVVVATAATGPQEVEATDKTEALRCFAPGAAIEIVQRETSTAATVAAFDAATAAFFTGGDQKRITNRYRAGDVDGDELLAMRRLLQRGGVLGGGSAGCAMLGERMLLSGSSSLALGIAPPPDGEAPPVLGPRVGPGMGLLPGVLTDSHFFERDRVGRLVAALAQGPDRFGLGVGEDAALAIDVATRTAVGLTVSESLWVDGTFAATDGRRWHGLRARLVGLGERLPLQPLGALAPRALPANPADVREVPVVEPGQNRQLASWRLFKQAAVPGAGPCRLRLQGFEVLAMPDDGGHGIVVFEVRRID